MPKSSLSSSIFWGTFLGIGAILVVTNPNQTAYAEHLATHLHQKLERNVCRKAGFLHGGCLSVLKASQSELERSIEARTQRKNFGLFSLYETELFILPLSPPYQVKEIGIAGRFYNYQEEELSGS